MKKIFLFLLIFVGVKAYSQVPFEMGAIKVDSVYYNGSLRWLKTVSNDTSLTSEDSLSIPTEYAVKQYVDDEIAQKQDSIDAHTDSLQAIRSDVNTNTTGIASHADSIAAHTDSLQAIRVDVNTNITNIASHADSIAAHTDSLQGHNNRLKVLEDSVHQHANKTILDATTATYTDADSIRLLGVNDTILVMIRVTDDTLTSSEVKSGYIFPIGSDLDGCTLIKVEAMSPGNGDGSVEVKVYRLRSAAVATVTSTGADINGTATIDTDYDDVEFGDYYDFGYIESGATTYTIAVDVYLKFIR